MSDYLADPKAAGQKWLDKLRAAEKREERWTADAVAAEKAYTCGMCEGDTGKVYDFNILHSNVETIVPAVFNSSPVPDIRERFRTGDADPMSAVYRVVAGVYDKALRVQIDDGAMVVEVERVAQDAFLAGRGVLRLRFDADEVQPEPMLDEMGQLIEQPPRVEKERLIYEAVSWRDFRMGPAMRWRDVPWVAFRQCVTAEEVERLTDPALKEKLAAGNDPDSRPVLAASPDEDVYVWEIWCRESATVKWLVEHSGELIAEQPDPLGLPQFFPCAEPLQPITVTGRMTPVCPFTVYRRLADELETITRRIRGITSGLKVRGWYIGEAGDLAKLAEAGDNELVPVANLEAMAQTGGLDKAVAWWPIETAVAVLRELYVSRDATKAMIYEVTGISDIIRGDSQASETATAQQIKTQWGSIRIRKMQRSIERLVRDVFVLSVETISRHFSPETLQKITGEMIPPEAMQVLSAPLDHYRVDVESDSTVRADMQGKRGEMGEFLQGTASYFQTLGPMIAQAPATAPSIMALYAAFARQFSLGKQAEDALEELAQLARNPPPPPAPPPPTVDPNAEREAGLRGRELDVEEMRISADMQRAQMEAMGGMNGGRAI